MNFTFFIYFIRKAVYFTKQDRNKILSNSFVVCLLAFVSCALWGSAFPCVKIGYRMFGIAQSEAANQIFFAGVRFAAAGVMVIVFGSICQKKLLFPKAKEFPKVAALSFFQTIMQYVLYYIGLANTTGVKASIIIGSNVFTAILISSLVFKLEKLTVRKSLGCVLGFAGIVIINLGGKGFDLNFKLKGEGFLFLCTFAYAFSSVLMKKYSKDTDPVMLSGWQFLFGGIVMILLSLPAGGNISVNTLPSFIMLMYLAFISAAAYSLWSILLKHNPVSKVAVYGFMNPVVGVILSSLLLNEAASQFGITAVIALLFVCLGIYIVNRK